MGDEDEEEEAEAEPGPPDAEHGAEGELLERVALRAPRLPEADVAQADRAPREERREAAQRDEPVEHDLAALAQVHERQRPECEHEDERPERSPGFVDVGEDRRRIARFGER